MTGAFGELPERWRSDRLLLGDRGRWVVTRTHEAAGSALLELAVGDRVTLLGRGAPGAVRSLLDRVRGPVDWATLPRIGGGPAGVHGAPDDDLVDAGDDLPEPVRARLGVQPATAWDWMVTTEAPGEPDLPVEPLDPRADAEAIRDCLAEANPGTQAEPSAPGEAAWFGVSDGGRLVGVVGAGTRLGDPAGTDLSWHLHGLAVRHDARSRGLGGALTATATRAGLAAGADWVSLGLYASNATARRVYLRLGFAVEGSFTSYHAAAGSGPSH